MHNAMGRLIFNAIFLKWKLVFRLKRDGWTLMQYILIEVNNLGLKSKLYFLYNNYFHYYIFAIAGRLNFRPMK